MALIYQNTQYMSIIKNANPYNTMITRHVRIFQLIFFPFPLSLSLEPLTLFFGEFNLGNGQNDHILRDPTVLYSCKYLMLYTN